MVGQTVWFFDGNRRIYSADKRVVYRHHFYPKTIVGQTRSSWLVADAYSRGGMRRISKKNWTTVGGFGLSARVYRSESEVDDAVFMHDYKHLIAEAVHACDNAQTLRRVGSILSVDMAKAR